MTEKLLRLAGIDTFYGPVQVHFGLNIEVGAGQIVCLLGGNASGKSTTMKIILGLLRPRAGTVTFDGRDITGWPTPRIIRAGIGSVPEARRLFGAMTVRENLLMGAYARSDRPAIAQDYERVLDLFPRVRQRIVQRAGTLSGGEQQMVAMARALMGRPRLICMDEPTMGLSPLYVDRVLELIAEINRQGTSVFMVEQNASLALRIAHHGYVLQTGRIVLSGTAETLLHDPAIRDAYLGGRTQRRLIATDSGERRRMNSNSDRCAIAVMAKAPRAGRVKTRLCPPLAPEEARAMSAAFLRDITENLFAAAAIAPIDPFVAYAPEGTEDLFDGVLAQGTRLLLADGAPAMPSGIEGFGRSLLHAVQELFALGYAAACVLNADSPTLPTARLVETAAALLRPGARAVLGAADDGGYFILGMQAPHARLFADIAWSTDLVADQTRARAAELGLPLVELAPWYDVDDRAALLRLLAELSGSARGDDRPWSAPATAACAAQLALAARLAVDA